MTTAETRAIRRRNIGLGGGLSLAAFDRIPDELADDALCSWDHWLKGCDRPFGFHSFGLFVAGELVSVAVSASTPNETCAHYSRYEVVELVRLCSAPEHRDMTRVALRLWRKIAPVEWAADYWTPVAVVSYQDCTRHKGDVYRFDGWRKVAETKGSTGGGTWSRPRKDGAPKAVWAFDLVAHEATGADSASTPPPAPAGARSAQALDQERPTDTDPRERSVETDQRRGSR